MEWFDRCGRDLPWRRAPDPYRTWVSEVMLQQTQVERVVDYFHRFLARFPDVARLAAASEAEVLRQWEGLGYYRRARQLHAAAKRIVAAHGGRTPATFEALLVLPGIGRYTAGAIASIAGGERRPIVEANSRRVLARLVAHRSPLGGAAGDGPLWEVAEALLPPARAGDWNQALMDLGATLCTPRAPECHRCPVAGQCRARLERSVATIPAAAPRRAIEARRERALVVRRAGRVLLVRRGPGEWWEGLWDFPRLPADALLAPLECGPRRRAGTVSYTVTHHRVSVAVAVCDAAQPGPRRRGMRWVAWDDLAGVAMTSPGRRIATLAAAPVPARVPPRARPPRPPRPAGRGRRRPRPGA
ncbi:MAG: A/G-specific adenine glycosylase [Planctomycetaceae bacterium]